MNDLPNLIGSGELLEIYSTLKGVDMSKVLRNATKDFVQGAYDVTPEAPRIQQSEWAYLPGRGKKKGETVTVHLSTMPPDEQQRLEPYRLAKPKRGYALSAFIPVFQDPDLEFKTQKPRGAKAALIQKQGSTFQKKSGGDQSFKRSLEAYRESQSAHFSPQDYSSEDHGGVEDEPWWEVQITETNLDAAYPDWSVFAGEAGMRNASERILKDLQKTWDRL